MVNCVERLCQVGKHSTSSDSLLVLIDIGENLVDEIGYSRRLSAFF